MTSITDALKAKHPEATGDTIAEVIRTMDASGGGSGGVEMRIVDVIPGNSADSYLLDITNRELITLLNSGAIVFVRYQFDTEESGITTHGCDIGAIISYIHGGDPETPSSPEESYTYYTNLDHLSGMWIGDNGGRIDEKPYYYD